MAKAIFKFNNGNFALLCSDCNVIIKTGKDFTEKEWAAVEGTNNLESYYCDTCKVKHEGEMPEKKETVPLDFVKNVLPFLENEELKKNLLEGIVKNKLNINFNLNDDNLGSDN